MKIRPTARLSLFVLAVVALAGCSLLPTKDVEPVTAAHVAPWEGRYVYQAPLKFFFWCYDHQGVDTCNTLPESTVLAARESICPMVVEPNGTL